MTVSGFFIVLFQAICQLPQIKFTDKNISFSLKNTP
ncbi:hypothetical protein X965_18910 [Morganella sp. EGD-HP17]|nr:hypothetical protein X965_18910 [Morganella sp. EGD-HP17]